MFVVIDVWRRVPMGFCGALICVLVLVMISWGLLVLCVWWFLLLGYAGLFDCFLRVVWLDVFGWLFVSMWLFDFVGFV